MGKDDEKPYGMCDEFALYFAVQQGLNSSGILLTTQIQDGFPPKT